MMNALALADLESWSNVGRNAVQILALLVGGGWAWLKFVRGRTFRRRGELTVEGGPARVRWRVRTRGQGCVQEHRPRAYLCSRFSHGDSQSGVHKRVGGRSSPVAASGARQLRSRQEGSHYQSVTKALAEASLVMLETTEVVEPGETVADDHIFVAAEHPDVGITVAYRLRAALMTKHGFRRRKTLVWTAYAVVAGAPLRELGQPPSTSVPGKKEG